MVNNEWIDLKPANLETLPSGLAKISFSLPMLLPCTNKLNSMHWGERKQIADEMLYTVGLITSHLIPKTPFKRARLVLIRRSIQVPDADGMVGSFKSLIDALVKLKILEDDSYEHIQMPDYKWFKVKKKDQQLVEVTIEER